MLTRLHYFDHFRRTLNKPKRFSILISGNESDHTLYVPTFTTQNANFEVKF